MHEIYHGVDVGVNSRSFLTLVKVGIAVVATIVILMAYFLT